MTIAVNSAFHITLTYSGAGKYTATWVDIGRKSIRRAIHPENWHDTDGAAVVAAELFIDWLNQDRDKNFPNLSWCHTIKSITLSYMKTDKNAIAVQTDTVAKDEAA